MVEWEREQEFFHGHTIRREIAEYKTQEKMIEVMRIKAAKAKDIDQQNQLREKVAELEAKLVPPRALPSLFGNDLTPEALAHRVHEQDGRYAILSDEGGVLETLSGLYSNNAANIDILLKGIDAPTIKNYGVNRHTYTSAVTYAIKMKNWFYCYSKSLILLGKNQ